MTHPKPLTPSPFTDSDARAVASARAVALEVVQAKGHGHAGTAMALAPLAHVLFSRTMTHSPEDPAWLGRDRFILSAGHASLLLYVQLHFSGYELELEEIGKARSLDSRTPGHPELGHTPGVEMSTGPLGQGVASAVGLAAAARRSSALLDEGEDEKLFDSTVWVVAGDGCLQEGVSNEASSLAGTLGLDNLVLIWDDNRITIDGDTSLAFSEDVRARYRALGWRVLEIDDVNDLDAVAATLAEARERTGRPTFVAVRTVIGYPAPERAGTPAAHSGAFSPEDAAAVKTSLGFSADASLAELVPVEVLEHTREAVARGRAAREAWQTALTERETRRPELAAARAGLWPDPSDAAAALAAIGDVPAAAPGASVATRSASGALLTALSPVVPLWGGSADLTDSTSVSVEGSAFTRENPRGEFVRFGIREHAMAAFLSGVALHGAWRAYGSTYLAFSDYLRPSLRLAALMELPALYVFTHDSVAVGEDGPTHQPVEQIAGLRTVPGLAVVRPGDAEEVRAVWRRLVTTESGPTALILSRQALPVLPRPVHGGPLGGEHSGGAERGGYVVWQHGAGDALALIATGSELHLAFDAAQALAAEGVAVRVVSLPSVEWFEAESAEYRASVLPAAITARVVVEAGVTGAWWKYAGTGGRVLGIDRFGVSGSGAQVLERYGITTAAVLDAAREALAGA